MLGLRWKDLDLQGGFIHLQVSLQRTANGYEFVLPKTSRSRRQVMLTAAAIEALRKHRVSQTAERLVKGELWQNKDDLVFTNLTGGALDGTRAGLPEIRFHDLRHTAATLLLGQGLHPKIVPGMLGHSTVNITLDLYSHVTPTMQRDAVNALNTLLRP